MSVVDAALRAPATLDPATLDPATLDVTAILRHVVDVETSLPPPRGQRHPSINTTNNVNVSANASASNVNTHPDVRVVQLPRYDRRRDATDFDDEDVDLFLVAARTSRVVGAGLVAVSRRGDTERNNQLLAMTGIGSGDDGVGSDDDGDDGDDDGAKKGDGHGNLSDPMGGDRYGPVTICCAYCEEEEDDGDDDSNNNNDDDLDEMITCLSISTLKDCAATEGADSGDNDDHRVAIVLGTSFGRVLSTELGVHYSRGIRRMDGGDGGDNSADPFEPLPLDYDDDDLFEYYGHDGRRQGPGNGSGNAGDTKEARDTSTARGGSGSSGAGTSSARDDDDRFFHPEGGVKSIAIHVDRHGPATSSTCLPPSSSVVSVTYGDGACVRLPHFAFFKSVIESLNASGNSQQRPKVSIQRFKVDGESNGAGLLSENVLFLPKSHPSLLSPTLVVHDSNTSTLLSPNSFSRPDSPSPMSDGDSTEAEGAQTSTMDIDDSGQEIGTRTTGRSGEDDEYDFCEAVTFGRAGGSTIQFHSSNESPPPLFSCGSNDKELNEEEQSQDGGLGLVTGAVVGVAAGVFGAAVGAVSWGLGGGKNRGTRSEDIKTSKDDGNCDDDSDSTDVLSRLRDRPVSEVGTGLSMLDPPRNITSIVVDPDGDLAATTDTLGRVLLIELSSKQVVRIWKGVRDASCCWIQAPRPSHLSQWGKTNQLYLAIHCRQRRTVEVWRVLHGPRVSIQNVSRDASLVPCIGPASEGSLAKCFILDPSSLASTKNVMASVSIIDPEVGLHLNQVPSKKKLTTTRKGSNDNTSQPKKQAATTSISSAPHQSASDAIQLQLLKQQLASETNLPSSPDAIFDALIQICSLSDLSTALDLLSTATHLEEGMGIQGSSFHCRVVEHCEKRLNSASEAHATSNNPHLRALRIKIVYHKQILSAYDVLHSFEAKHLATVVTAEGNDATTADESIPWMKEALGWIEAFATIATGSSFPGEITAATESMGTVALKFSAFAKSCMPLTAKEIAAIGEEDISANKHPTHLIDSKRDRTVVLLHIFRPLLKDIFVFKVVNNVFDSLGLTKDRELLQQYFGEWFLSLPHKCWADTGLMVRWLQELVVHVLKEEETETGNDIADTEGRRILLGSLYQFCSSCDNLPRAFPLAAICRQAVALATKQQETKTYGKILSADEILPWDCLLRKLRVCLLITLRLPGVQLGSFPVTISNIDDGSIFSIYEWVAMDELFLSHNHEKISNLEESCRRSPHSFDPSSEVGDEPARWGLLQQTGQHRRNPIAPADGEPGPLLLYLSRFNDPIKLAAHRILLLGEKWGKDPQSIDVLRDALPALNFLQESREEYQGAVVTAVCIDLWQTRIRPVYRALLFGFDDVPELSEDIVAPLCLDYNWVREVSGVALVVLSLLAQTGGQFTTTDLSPAENHSSVVTTMTNVATSALQKLFGDENDTENSHGGEIDICNNANNAWPNARDDTILRNLISNARPTSPVSLDIHRAIVCAAKLTDDLSSLSYCVPTFTDVFLQGSLFENMTLPTEFSEHQEEFINDVVLKKALRAEGPLIDQTELEELETLAYAWGVERIRLRAQFLLHMVDAGKDDMITELANMSGEQLDYPLVVEGGLEIACARLNRIIVELKRAKIFRSILAVLDAEACKWIKKEAEKAADHLITSAEHGIDEDEDFEWQSPPLSSTHAFILRLLRMSSSVGDSESSQKAHSLSILSGSLLNAVQEHSELREYDFDWIG